MSAFKPRLSDMVYQAYQSKDARAKVLNCLYQQLQHLAYDVQLELAHELIDDIHECIARLQEKRFEAKASKKQHGRTDREIIHNREHTIAVELKESGRAGEPDKR